LKTLKHLFDSNLAWSNKIKQQDPGFFTRLSKQQTPEYLWIGCSDSRVSANVIVDLLPGEIFVHRNIANVVVHTDMNCLSVIQFSVEVLKVKHIIVCGHYGCGGIRAAMEDTAQGLLGNWLGHVKDIASLNANRLDGLDHEEQCDLLCELNVMAQATNVCNLPIVQKAWEDGAGLCVHGWIYDIRNGVLKDLGASIESNEQLAEWKSKL
jgi:carbonic anhydrase